MIDPSFFYIKKIEKSNIGDCTKIAEAVFGTTELAEFTEEFIPLRGRVPSPKVENFASYLNRVVKDLFAILNPNSGNNEEIIGFILLSDTPYKQALSIGLNKNFVGKGIAKTALLFALENLKKSGIELPIYAYTSKENISALGLLTSVDFRFISELNDFMGLQNMYKYDGFLSAFNEQKESDSPKTVVSENASNVDNHKNESQSNSNDILCIFVNNTSLSIDGKSTTSKWYEAFLKFLINNYSIDIEASDEKTLLNKVFSRNPEDYDRFGESIKYNRIVGYSGWFYNTHKSSSIKIGVIKKLAIELNLQIDIIV
jgi:ribosomal protein S18 acetylase RimI-like enzyme